MCTKLRFDSQSVEIQHLKKADVNLRHFTKRCKKASELLFNCSRIEIWRKRDVY